MIKVSIAENLEEVEKRISAADVKGIFYLELSRADANVKI